MELTEQDFKDLNEAQRKAVQQQLKDAGHYFGTIDGKWGGGTETAIKLSRKAASDKASGEAETALTQAKAKKTAAEAETAIAKAEEEKRKSAARTQYAKDAQSLEGIGTKIAVGLAGPAAYPVGRMLGGGLNWAADRSQRKKNESLKSVADSRLAGETTREGARVGAERSGAMPPRNSGMRVGGRMLPHAVAGLGMLGKGASIYAQEDPDEGFYPTMANRALALTLGGIGLGTLEKGAAYALSPGEVPNARDIAIIESNQLRRQPGRTAQSLAGVPTKTELYREAQALNLPGRSKMNRTQLAEALAKAKEPKQITGPSTASRLTDAAKKGRFSSVAVPLAAGGMAYDAATSEAEAAGMSPAGQTASGVGAGVAAGGTTAATQHGLSKLAQALAGSRVGPYLGPAMNVAGAGLAAHDYAGQVQDMRQDMPEGMQSDLLAQAAPLAMRGMEDAAAWQNLPGQAQEFVQRNQSDPAMGMSDEVQAMPPQAPPQAPPGSPPPNPMLQANALEIPRDQIRQSQTDMAFDPAMRDQPQGMQLPPEIDQQVQMLIQQGAPPELVASYLNHIASQ